jgi:hypothetical protein
MKLLVIRLVKSNQNYVLWTINVHVRVVNYAFTGEWHNSVVHIQEGSLTEHELVSLVKTLQNWVTESLKYCLGQENPAGNKLIVWSRKNGCLIVSPFIVRLSSRLELFVHDSAWCLSPYWDCTAHVVDIKTSLTQTYSILLTAHMHQVSSPVFCLDVISIKTSSSFTSM